jgi:N6-adenosine-specific RNA methylase IME4
MHLFEDTENTEPEVKEINAVVIDPPWNQTGGGKIRRGADRHYKLMKQPEIISTCKKMLSQYEVSDNAHFYIWVTNNQVPDGLNLMEELGVRYVTNVCWVKKRIGLGYYFRGQHELMLFGVKGNGAIPKSENKKLSSVIVAKARQHSRKPEESYRLVEKRTTGRILYLFSRQKPKDRWIMVGDEINKFD